MSLDIEAARVFRIVSIELESQVLSLVHQLNPYFLLPHGLFNDSLLLVQTVQEVARFDAVVTNALLILTFDVLKIQLEPICRYVPLLLNTVLDSGYLIIIVDRYGEAILRHRSIGPKVHHESLLKVLTLGVIYQVFVARLVARHQELLALSWLSCTTLPHHSLTNFTT